MKKQIKLLSFFLLISSFCIAQTTRMSSKKADRLLKDNSYCVLLREADHYLVVKKADQEVLEDVVLENGSTLRMDGVVIHKNGSSTPLNFGECVDASGNPVYVQEYKLIRDMNRIQDRELNWNLDNNGSISQLIK